MAGERPNDDSPRPGRRPTGAVVERAYREIRHRIIHGVYYPGQRLSENALSNQYGLSRTPVRQVLQRLANEGLVLVKPKSGTYVEKETTRNFVDLLQVRSYLEGLAFRLAVERAENRDIDELAEIKAAMDRELRNPDLDKHRFSQLHIRFHEQIVAMSRNEVLVESYRRLNLRASHMYREMNDAEGAAHTQREHAEILRLLRARDRNGERFVVDHLWRKRDALIVQAEKEAR